MIIAALFLVAAAGYVIYMQAQYYRIEDFIEIDTKNPKQKQVKMGTAYRIMTYNIGFGAYSADYSFFMDTGEMEDGTKTVGAHARALSKEEEQKNTADVPTCRGADIPYEKGVTYTVIIDGFIVSDNIEAAAKNIDEGLEGTIRGDRKKLLAMAGF